VADTDPGEAVLARAVSAYRNVLGSRLIAGYALGSLAHGGFSALVSDVDLGLILRDPVTMKDRITIRGVARSVKAGESALDQRLSVFWGTPATLAGQRRGGRFPPLDRLDLLEHGRLLTGQDVRAAAARPDRAELLVAGAEFALGYLGGAARLRSWARLRRPDETALTEIRTPALLVSRGPRRMTKIVLFPVRFLFTAETGQVATNTLAAEHYLAGANPPAATLVAAALAWRLEPPPADEATALLSRELIPLYVQYLDDHITRLNALDRRQLAGRFERWRARLLAPNLVSSRSRVAAQGVMVGNLDQDDPDAVGVLDPHLDQSPGLGHGFPDDGDAGCREPRVLGADIPHLDPDHHRRPGRTGRVPGDLEQSLAEEEHHPGILGRAELTVDGQAQHVAVEAAAPVQVAGPQQDPAAQNLHVTTDPRIQYLDEPCDHATPDWPASRSPRPHGLPRTGS
jgi:hypothetical protein